jgi:hypothetical protein
MINLNLSYFTNDTFKVLLLGVCALILAEDSVNSYSGLRAFNVVLIYKILDYC